MERFCRERFMPTLAIPMQFCAGQILIALPFIWEWPIAETPNPLCYSYSPRPSSSRGERMGTRGFRDSPETRALTFLAREVSQWSATNNCFSCHNNGDAARALYAAKRVGYAIPADSLEATTDWLAHPERWDHNGGDGPFNNKQLARIQFSAALQSAIESGFVQNRDAIVQAAMRLADEQDADGSWLSDSVGAVGSPATYGRALATLITRETLRAADPMRFGTEVEKAHDWLLRREIHNIMDAAVVLLASAGSPGEDWRRPRVEAFALVLKGQSADGGWGPFVTAAPEPFDTALVLLALVQNTNSLDCQTIVKRGREFLIKNQQPDGSWRETTRPAGADSYAQRISTTAWATQALLMTR
jgi:hypothetical protein